MNSCRITYIYGLYEVGKEDEIRYVGKSDNPKSRTYSHIYVSKKTKIKPTHKECWIRKVLSDKGTIGYRILEEVTYDNWSEKEVHWISKLNNLTNTSPGGETGITGKQFEISYDECKVWVSENLPNVKSKKEWHESIKKNKIPEYIPKSPHTVFINIWISWSDFLNSNYISCHVKSKKYLSYDECKIWFKENINITDVKSWNSLCKTLPYFIPKKPTEHFNDIWSKNSWMDFIGIDFTQDYNHITYEDAIKFVRPLKLKSQREWVKYYKENNKNKDFPKISISVHSVYRNEWISWSDFLGKKDARFKITYCDLVSYVRENLHFIRSKRKWSKYIEDNKINLPKNPQSVYKNKGWVSWNSFLSK